MASCPLSSYVAYRRAATLARMAGEEPPTRDYRLERLCYADRPEAKEKKRKRAAIRRWATKNGLVSPFDGTHIHSEDHHRTNRHLVILSQEEHRRLHQLERARARAAKRGRR